MNKYTLTFTRAKTKCVVHYYNGQFKKFEYVSGGMKDDFWKNITKAIPFDEHHIPEVEKAYENRVQFSKIEKPQKPDYNAYLEVYYSFFQSAFGIRPKITAAEGQSLKQSIAYLQKESTTNEEALLVWKQIFTNWTRLDDFYQGQNTLKQINSNLTTILIQIKDGSNKTGKSINEHLHSANAMADEYFRES